MAELKYKSLYGGQEFDIYLIKFVQSLCNFPIKDSWTLNCVILLILESFDAIWGHLSEFENSVRYCVVNRDKVGNFGRSDDQTLFENESNLRTKRAFTHDIFRWNRKVGPVVSLSLQSNELHIQFSAC